jgi:hypothetical protein
MVPVTLKRLGANPAHHVQHFPHHGDCHFQHRAFSVAGNHTYKV